MHKHTIELLILGNSAVVGISLAQINGMLTFVSLSLAIGLSVYKIIKMIKRK